MGVFIGNMSGISFPQGGFIPINGPLAVTQDWTQPVSKELREQIEQCVDDEAVFAAIQDDNDSVIDTMGYNGSGSWAVSGIPLHHQSSVGGSGYIYTPPAVNASPASMPSPSKKFCGGFFDWFLPAGT